MLTLTVDVPLTRCPLNVGSWSTNLGTLFPSSGVWGVRTDACVVVPVGSAAPGLCPHPAARTSDAPRDVLAKSFWQLRMVLPFFTAGFGARTAHKSPRHPRRTVWLAQLTTAYALVHKKFAAGE